MSAAADLADAAHDLANRARVLAVAATAETDRDTGRHAEVAAGLLDALGRLLEATHERAYADRTPPEVRR